MAVTGFLLVKYNQGAMTWLTITIGLLFFLSGAVSCIIYYVEKERIAKRKAKAEKEETDALKSPSFPLAGVGSVVLGIILAVMPETFVIGMVYILAALLILGAINLFITLARSKQYAHVPVYLWLLPTLILIVAIFSIHKPIEAAALPLKVIGWAFMCYGVIELLFSIRNFYIRKAFEKAEESKIVEGFKLANENIEDAEIIEEEKPTT